MTIICIAHRLKTIQKADKIFVVHDGRVVEEGIFKEMKYFQQIKLIN
jgi:ABC-type multidrug transport system fused ATPase/permease subunit